MDLIKQAEVAVPALATSLALLVLLLACVVYRRHYRRLADNLRASLYRRELDMQLLEHRFKQQAHLQSNESPWNVCPPSESAANSIPPGPPSSIGSGRRGSDGGGAGSDAGSSRGGRGRGSSMVGSDVGSDAGAISLACEGGGGGEGEGVPAKEPDPGLVLTGPANVEDSALSFVVQGEEPIDVSEWMNALLREPTQVAAEATSVDQRRPRATRGAGHRSALVLGTPSGDARLSEILGKIQRKESWDIKPEDAKLLLLSRIKGGLALQVVPCQKYAKWVSKSEPHVFFVESDRQDAREIEESDKQVISTSGAISNTVTRFEDGIAVIRASCSSKSPCPKTVGQYQLALLQGHPDYASGIFGDMKLTEMKQIGRFRIWCRIFGPKLVHSVPNMSKKRRVDAGSSSADAG